MVEANITEFYCVSKICSPVFGKKSDVEEYTEEEKISEDGMVRVRQEVRLDNRNIDMRAFANQAIF